MHFKFIVVLICSLLLSVAFPIQSNDHSNLPFFERIGPFGGDVRSLLIDAKQPRIAYLGTSDGNIYKSTNSGATWVPLNPGIGQHDYVIDTLVQHPGEPNHIFAGAWDLHSEGGGLFESKDAGATWTRIALPHPFSAVRGFALCRSMPSRMIVGTLDGAYVSKDEGHAWKKVGGRDLEKAESVAIDPIDPRFLYVGTWRLSYRSIDFGKTWILVDKGMPLDSDVFSIAIDARNPAIVYSSACSGAYLSTNRAQSWTRLKILPDRFAIRAQLIYMDPIDQHKVYSGTTEGLFVSTSNGREWVRLTPANVTVNAIQVNPSNNRQILIGTEYQGILLSEDEGKSWKESNAGFIHKQISWILPDPGVSGNLIAGMLSGEGGFYRYDDRKPGWTLFQIEPGMRILSFLYLPKDYGKLVGTSQGLYWQRKQSDRWEKMKGSVSRRTIYSLALDPLSPIVYAGTDQGIYRTSLTAMDFRIPPAYRLSPKVWCFATQPKTPELVYAGASLGLLRSYDKGTTWNVISTYGLPDHIAIEAIAVSPANPEHLFAGTSGGLFESKNGGVYWRGVGDGRMGISISSVIFLDDSGDRILAGDKTSGGVFYSRNGGETWEKFFSGDFSSPVYCITRHPQKPSQVYLGTRSDGVYRLTLPLDSLSLGSQAD
jgi:photosystem II stability/assembly factor-like uncharacterized protein